MMMKMIDRFGFYVAKSTSCDVVRMNEAAKDRENNDERCLTLCPLTRLG